MQVPSLFNVASPRPNIPEAQLFHTPAMFGHRCACFSTGLLVGAEDAGDSALPPEIDFSCLPVIVPGATFSARTCCAKIAVINGVAKVTIRQNRNVIFSSPEYGESISLSLRL